MISVCAVVVSGSAVEVEFSARCRADSACAMTELLVAEHAIEAPTLGHRANPRRFRGTDRRIAGPSPRRLPSGYIPRMPKSESFGTRGGGAEDRRYVSGQRRLEDALRQLVVQLKIVSMSTCSVCDQSMSRQARSSAAPDPHLL